MSWSKPPPRYMCTTYRQSPVRHRGTVEIPKACLHHYFLALVVQPQQQLPSSSFVQSQPWSAEFPSRHSLYRHSAGMNSAPVGQFERPARFQLRRARPLADYIHPRVLTNSDNSAAARLHGSNLDSSTPVWEHNTSWIRIPATAIRAAQLGFLSFGVHGKVLASFWVLILVTYGILWKPGAWFLVSWATLCFIGFLLSFTIDQTSRRRSNSRALWITYASILPMLVCSSPCFVHPTCDRSKIH